MIIREPRAGAEPAADSQRFASPQKKSPRQLLLTVEAEVVVGEDGGPPPSPPHGHDDVALTGGHLLLEDVAVLPREGPGRGELQVDIPQLDVVHAVRRHRAETWPTFNVGDPRFRGTVGDVSDCSTVE